MNFSTQISQAAGLNPTGKDFIEIAQHAESIGFSTLWMGDHIVWPDTINSRYPYTKDGAVSLPPKTPWLDCIDAIIAMGACTKTINFGTGVLVVPWRHPIDLGKRVITADLMTGGRFLFGVGSGWLKEEFDALGIPFNERGVRTDESLRIMKAMWSGGDTTFNGRIFQIPKVHVSPLPVRKPHPPIIIGGNGAPAFKRILEFGDGWYMGPSSLQNMYDQLGQLTTFMLKNGRKVSDLRITVPLDMKLPGITRSILMHLKRGELQK